LGALGLGAVELDESVRQLRLQVDNLRPLSTGFGVSGGSAFSETDNFLLALADGFDYRRVDTLSQKDVDKNCAALCPATTQQQGLSRKAPAASVPPLGPDTMTTLLGNRAAASIIVIWAMRTVKEDGHQVL
jgi:hypothetical protein